MGWKYTVNIIIILTALLNFNCANKGTYKLHRDDLDKSMKKYLGTPYKYGGSSIEGMDCSGFTCKVYEENGISLPRTAKEQLLLGDAVDKNDLKFGDLLFFNLNGFSVSHVGIYRENGKFVHASTSKGVCEDELTREVFSKNYLAAKRIENSPYILAEDSKSKVLEVTSPPVYSESLFILPAVEVIPHRYFLLSFSSDSKGALLVNTGAGLFNFIELQLNLKIDSLLGNSKPGLNNPGFSVKLNLLDEGSILPEFSIGYEHVKRLKTSGILSDKEEKLNYRGAYFLLSKKYKKSSSFLIGDGEFQSGAFNSNRFKDFNLIDDLDLMFALKQRFLSRLIFVAEASDLIHNKNFSAGIIFSVMPNATLQFGLSDLQNLWTEKRRINKQLKFSYAFQF